MAQRLKAFAPFSSRFVFVRQASKNDVVRLLCILFGTKVRGATRSSGGHPGKNPDYEHRETRVFRSTPSHLYCGSKLRSRQERLQAFEHAQKLGRERCHRQHPHRRAAARVDPTMHQFSSVFCRVPHIYSHAFFGACYAWRHRRLNLCVAKVSAQRPDLRFNKLL